MLFDEILGVMLFNSLSANSTKWSNTQAIRRLVTANCLSMINHFEGWLLKVDFLFFYFLFFILIFAILRKRNSKSVT